MGREAGACGELILEFLLFLSSISKPLLKSKISCDTSLFLEQNSRVFLRIYEKVLSYLKSLIKMVAWGNEG